MNNRLTIQDVAALLAASTDKDQKSAELFLREFITALSDGVCTDKIVKVKRLGTFKVVLVEKRESIHVNTGERFLIPQHYKFSFLPDKELKELVNKPFSLFETTELNENVNFLDIEEQEQEEEKENDDESVEEMIPEKEELVVNEVSETIVEEVSEPMQEELEPVDEVLEPAQPVGYEPAHKPDIQSTVKYLVVAAVVITVVFVAGFYAYKMPHKAVSLKNGKPTVETAVSQTTSKKTVKSEMVADTLHKATATPDSVATPPPAPKVLAKLKIEPGSRLTVIALEHYGSKVFWVYLYEFNKKVIGDPNNIPIGTEILVPSPKIYGIDARNKASVAKAAALQTELLSGKL